MLDYLPFDPGVLNDDGRIYLYYGWALPMKPAKNYAVQKIYQKVMREMFPKKTEEEICSETPGIMGANVVELESDMLTVKKSPKRMIPCEMDAVGSGFEDHAFFEASSIRKIGDMYYFIYSSSVNHELCYATSKQYFNFEGKTNIYVMTRGRGSGKFLVCNRPGEILGEITIHPSENWIENETQIDVEGIHALYFIFQGKGFAEMLKFGFRKEA